MISGFDLLVVYLLLLWYVWEKQLLLSLTCVLMAAAVACLGLIYAKSVVPVVPPADEKPSLNRWSLLVFSCAGFYCAWTATQVGIDGAMPSMALWIGLSALAWRAAVLEPIPAPKGWALALLVLATVLVGAWFRLYKAGDIPVGYAGRDESGIWEYVWSYMGGTRLSYGPGGTGGADGVIPQYMIMAGLKVFGTSLFGFRSEGIIVGIFMTGIFYVLGTESLGVWAGLAAAFLWAVSLWPVTATRANYYMAETVFMVSVCMALLALGLRRGWAWAFAGAGLFWAFCFNVYPAARVMLAMIPWFYFLLWFLRRPSRPALLKSAPPLLAGFAVGIAPLVWWMVSAYPSSAQAYFAAFTSPIQAGNLASHSLAGNINEVLTRVIALFTSSFSLLTRKPMPYCPHYFPLQYPILHPWLLTLAVLGAGVALARFRNVFYAFLLYWWFIGFLPAVAGAPGTVTDRREIMILAPTLLLAAVGADTIARLLWTLLGKAWVAALALALCGIMAASAYGLASWHDYFDRNQRDAALMVDGDASMVDLARAVNSAMHGTGGTLISTWHSDDGSFYVPQYDNYAEEKLDAAVPGIRYYWYQRDQGSFSGGGLRAALNWALTVNGSQSGGPVTDVFVLLTPFNDYLEPGLKSIGAEEVAEVARPMSSDGPLGYTGMASGSYFARLLRLRNLDRAAVDRYEQRPSFEVDITELRPPTGSGADQARMVPTDERYEPLVRAYEHGEWGSGRTAGFMTDDPWFYTSAGTLPGGINAPFSLRIRALLSIERTGDYAFGASASVLTKITIDRKTVFHRDPFDPAEQVASDRSGAGAGLTWLSDDPNREGYLGPAVHLTQGQHVLEIDQAMLSAAYWNHVLRPIWSPAGQDTETLPLELLRPLR